VYANRDSILLQSSTIRDTFLGLLPKAHAGLVLAAVLPTLKLLDPKGLQAKYRDPQTTIANHSNSDNSQSASHNNRNAIAFPKLPHSIAGTGLNRMALAGYGFLGGRDFSPDEKPRMIRGFNP
jgi:hypothetical protein